MRQALQAQLQNGAGLNFREVVGAILVQGVAGIVDQPDKGRDLMRGPAPRHQLIAGFGGIGRGADGFHHLIHVGNRHGQTAEHMAAFARFAQFERGAPGHNFLAKHDKIAEEVAQSQLLGPPAVQGQHVAAEGGLHWAKAVKLVENDIRRGIALQLDHHSHTDAVGFISHARDALDLLVAHHFGNDFNHPRFVHLIGDLIDDDRPAVLADFFHMGLGADDDRAAPLKIGFARA